MSSYTKTIITLAAVAQLLVLNNNSFAEPLSNALPVFTPSESIVSPLPSDNLGTIANVMSNGNVIGNISVAGSAMTVTQSVNKMIVDWNSFNIGSKASVHFDQPNVASSVLNRVASTDKMSEIYGQLTSNGQVYLINPNGILFGAGAVVNVNTLIASSLHITNNTFNKGILSIINGDPAFEGTVRSGPVIVEKTAELKANGGKVMLFAPTVTNDGMIRTPDGQTLLAAGQKVYLYASSEPNMRGLLVEVDGGGTVTNLNEVIAERGNITLAGMAVNQNGRLKATTSLTANGSIRLQAQHNTNTGVTDVLSGFIRRKPQEGGEVVLGTESLTSVLLDDSDISTVIDSVSVNKSFVNIIAKNIHLLNNAKIVVPSGEVSLIASLNPFTPTILDENSSAISNNSHIFFENASGIDVSGIGSLSNDRIGESPAKVLVASNVVEAELRSIQLNDSPLQRTGILKAAKVYVDSRLTASDGSVGTSLADVSGYTSQIQKGLSERLSSGGNVKVQSEGDIVFAPSAFINVSGGRVEYLGGIVNKTKLLASNGQSYEILNASKDLTYTSIQNLSYYEQGYTNGKDAGQVLFSAPSMLLEGQLNGAVLVGERQRQLSMMPNGATLQIGQNKANLTALDSPLLKQTYVLHSDLVLDAAHVAEALPSYGVPLSSIKQQTLTLGNNFTAPPGFKNLVYYADGLITLKNGTTLTAMPGGKITLNGGGVLVQGQLVAHAGTIDLSSKVVPSYIGDINNTHLKNVELGSTSSIDVSGLWTNDLSVPAHLDTVAIAGGTLNIYASSLNNSKGNILLNTGSVINASGGAWLNRSGSVIAGMGGNIALYASAGISDNLTSAHDGKLIMNGLLRADSLSIGGNLTLSSGSITIGSEVMRTAGEALINPSFFQQGGFNSYSLNGFEGLVVADGTTIAPISMTRILDRGYVNQKSGEDIQNFSYLSFLPATNSSLTRKATNLTLSASNQWTGVLTLGSKSNIILDPSASLALLGKRQLTILGSIKSPAGNITMTSGLISGESSAVPYFGNQTLWLGKNSILDVSGIVDSYTNPLGLNVGTVKDAGSISLKASRGVIVAQDGAKIHLDGARALIDLQSGQIYSRQDVASKGGSLTISAREGVLWDAIITARGGSERVAAGSFALSVPLLDIDAVNNTNSNFANQIDKFPTVPREIILTSGGSFVPANLGLGDLINPLYSGKAYLSADNLVKSGFESISLSKADNIHFAESLTLSARGAINLDAPNLILSNAANVKVNASYVSIGNDQVLALRNLAKHLKALEQNAGEGTFSANADYIDLYGQQNFHGISNASFNSAGDVQLRGVLKASQDLELGKVPTTPIGNLQTAGNLSFIAGRIYPSSLSNYSLKALGANSTITFNRAADAVDVGVPFSVLGTLNVEAKTIQQDGLVRAPFGVINLKAQDQLILGGGGLTSVSALGSVLPFGSTVNGKTWNFDEGDRIAKLTTMPEKQVNLDGQSVKILAGAQVDTSGGGDLVAWEFTPGTGGSKDVLSDSGVFAVLPEFKAGYMAGNSESYSNATLKAGDSIYLSGGNGLTAGSYMLLPAHYALLAGAYSVKVVSGTQNMLAQQNILNLDGSMLVSGYKMQYGGLVSDARTSGFLVSSGAIARSQSEFTTTLASDFYKAAYSDANLKGYRLLDDAGRLAISAVTNLVLNGNMTMLASNSGRGAEVDISAAKIAISGNATTKGNGYLTLSDTMLNAMGAESLFIGGKRSSVASGTQLDVTASNVELIAEAALSGQEIILAATDKVATEAGTRVSGSGTVSTHSGSLNIGVVGIEADPGNNIKGIDAVSGDGALLMVSSGAQKALTRASVARTIGTLDLKGDITNAKSVILDATYLNTLNGAVGMAKDGSALAVGAPNISFGETNAAVGLLFNSSRLSALGNPSNLLFNSYSTLDFYGAVTLGGVGLSNLSMRGAGIKGYENADKEVKLTAKTVDFTNTSKLVFGNPSSGTGAIVVNAKEIISGENTLKMAGFSQVTFNADQFMGQGEGELDVTGNLNINAKRITSASLSDQTIKASGAIQTSSVPVFPIRLEFSGDDPSVSATALGGKLTLVANTISHAGNIEMPAGIVTLKATGTGESLILKENSIINAKGSAQMLGTSAVLVDGGKINLLTTNGNISMVASAKVDVSATGGASAGSLMVSSSGSAKLIGKLIGDAAAGNDVANPTQGSFDYYASEFLNDNPFDDLNSALEKGGFNESRNIHVTKNDVIVFNTVTAHKFTLTTDDGDISITGNGKIDASGAKGGIVNLNAGQKSGSGKGNINLASLAIIDASSTSVATESAGSIGDGGQVILNASTDDNKTPSAGSKITLATESVINLSKGVNSDGNGLGVDGTLTLRAPRAGISSSGLSGTNVNLQASISLTNVKGRDASILIEGVKIYQYNDDVVIDFSKIATIKQENESFMRSPDQTTFGDDSRIMVVAGNEIRSAGSITLSEALDLQSWDPGALSLRAKGDVFINAHISSGFSAFTYEGETFSTDITGNPIMGQSLSSGGDWTYRIVAGADLTSADVIKTNSELKGDFTLAADKIIRTGTGDIKIAAGGNFKIDSPTAVIYTAGKPDNNPTNFIAPVTSDDSNVSYVQYTASYPVKGGSIMLDVKGNVSGAYSSQLPANWLFRQGQVGPNGYLLNTSWWSFYRDFKQNVGALAGGDVNISAGGSITDLSAVIATNGRVFGQNESNALLVVNGGGDLTLRAGSDITGGLYMVDKGSLKIRSDGALLTGKTTIENNTIEVEINPAFALGDGKIDVSVMGKLNIGTVFNPTLTGMSRFNDFIDTSDSNLEYSSGFLTYTSQSSVKLTSITSSVLVNNNGMLNYKSDLLIPNFGKPLQLFPGTLKIGALGGDISIDGSRVALVPSAQGSLELLSKGSLHLNVPINMSDTDMALIPSPNNPFNLQDIRSVLDKVIFTNVRSMGNYNSPIPVHQKDLQPVIIHAGKDIISTGSINLYLPKRAEIYAANDIKDLSIFGQNLHFGDVTSITAGRDIVNPISGGAGMFWGGPGYVNISAGRNIDLNTMDGIITRGNLDNPFLPENGASLSLLVGAKGASDTAFISKYLTPSANNSYSSALLSFVKKAQGMKDQDVLTVSEAWLIFGGMQAQLKKQFVQATFFNELAQAGIEHNDSASLGYGSYKRGFDAITTYFPNDSYSGNLNLSFSQIKTERGGDLNILAPGGGVIVGLPKTPDSLILIKGGGRDLATALAASAAKLGIFTIKGGGINIFANNNIDVAQSRVFTVAGGDILNWSSVGDIDAGKGSKTATSAPPPLVRTDAQGNTVVDLSGVVSGSGIGTLQTLKDAPLGNVYLIAPSGTVDAGDAGVRSSGNLVVAAQAVANGANMQAGGTSSGVPAPSTANVSFSAPVSADSSNSAKQADKATEAASKSANRTASALPSLITVEVLSLGDETSSASDPEKDEKKKAKKQ